MKLKSFQHLLPLIVLLVVINFFYPRPAESIPPKNIKDVLSNSQFSYYGGVGAGNVANDSVIKIDTSTSFPSRTSNDLFVGDTLSIGVGGSQSTYTVKDIFQKISITGEIYNPDIHYQAINGRIIISKNNQELFEQHLFPHTILAKNFRTLSCIDSNQEPSPCSLPIPLWPGYYQGKIILNNSSTPSLTFSFFIFPYSVVIFIIIVFAILFLSLRKKHC